MANREKTKAYCRTCATQTHHRVITMKTVSPPEEVDYNCNMQHMLIECMGCDEVSYLYEFHDFESYYEGGYGSDGYNIDRKQYPRAIEGHKELDGIYVLPGLIKKIYGETIDAISVQSYTLGSIGLRAIIEAICNDKKVAGKSLLTRIKKMAIMGLVSKADAERLHGIRFLGNDAAHEIKEAKAKAVLLALDIVEHILKSVYIFEDSVDSYLEIPFKRYTDLKHSLLKQLKRLSVGHQFTLKSWLGSESRRFIDNCDSLEDELIKDIEAGKFAQVSHLGKKDESGTGKEKDFYEKIS